MGRFSQISDDVFTQVVLKNFCIRDIVGELGYSRSSGSMAIKVKERIKNLNIDTSHFTGRKSKPQPRPKYSLEEILVENSKYEQIHHLKIRLVRAGLLEYRWEYRCARCGNSGYWNNKPLTLQLEHKNGIHNDHRIENLEFLCPNCHSQTETYSGRNKGGYIK